MMTTIAKTSVFSIFFAALAITRVQAQTGTTIDQTSVADSLRNEGMTKAAIMNPLLRQITMSGDYISKSKFHTDVNGKQVLEGKMEQYRTASLFNIPVVRWNKNTVGLSVLTLQQIAHFSEVNNATTSLNKEQLNYNKLTVGVTASFSRIDSLFGVPVYYTAAVTGTSSDVQSVKKMSYLAGAVFTLKQTRNTRVSLGGMLNIDPSLNIPFLPVIGYWHQFNNGLEIDINLPSRLALKQPLARRLWLSAGTNITGNISFFNDQTYVGIPNNVNYSSMELKTGLGLEYLISKKIMIGINGGIFSNLKSRAFDKDKKATDYFMESRFGAVPYANLTVSVLPFL
ncbi:DUF6268 family outer membrane beta-barrel protein [Filimonas lacunae]|nr:DUF6268 family outer membrane beta-barrel protein [Filimonas lacunae]